MGKYFSMAVFLTLMAMACACSSQQKHQPVFADLFTAAKEMGALDNALLNEASGIDASIVNPGKLWTHNDSGGASEVFLLNENGQVVGTVKLVGIKNRDWEDIIVGAGPEAGKSYLYIADIGDNEAKYDVKYIYRLAEPLLTNGQSIAVSAIDTIAFQLDNGKRDTEALMIDDATRDLYVFSKREKNIFLYTLPFPQRTDTINVAKKIATLPLAQIVAADFDSNRGEALIKNYDTVYYWKKEPSETILNMFTRQGLRLAYDPEPQGEAICFNHSGDGYYTLSEEAEGQQPHLLFYRRKK
jgi:hypothetical protein